MPFFVRKKSARLRGSQVIEEPCVGGEDSSSIRLALVPFRSILLSTVLFRSILSPLSYSLVSSLHCLIPTLPIFTDFYRFFGLSCRCITRCVIHQLAYPPLTSHSPPPPLTVFFLGGILVILVVVVV